MWIMVASLASALTLLAALSPAPPVCQAQWSDDRGEIEITLESPLGAESVYDTTRMTTSAVGGYAFEMLIFNRFGDTASILHEFAVIGAADEFARIDRAFLLTPNGLSTPTGSMDDQRVLWQFPQTDPFERWVYRGDVLGLEVQPVGRDSYTADLAAASRQAADFLADRGASVARTLRQRLQDGECAPLMNAG